MGGACSSSKTVAEDAHQPEGAAPSSARRKGQAGKKKPVSKATQEKREKKKRENAAATKIQAVQRGRAVRQQLAADAPEQEVPINQLQAIVRGKLVAIDYSERLVAANRLRAAVVARRIYEKRLEYEEKMAARRRKQSEEAEALSKISEEREEDLLSHEGDMWYVDEEVEEAAVKIQKIARGRMIREDIRLQHYCATKIQKVQRGNAVRRTLEAPQSVHEEEEEDPNAWEVHLATAIEEEVATVKIQALVRGRQTRARLWREEEEELDRLTALSDQEEPEALAPEAAEHKLRLLNDSKLLREQQSSSLEEHAETAPETALELVVRQGSDDEEEELEETNQVPEQPAEIDLDAILREERERRAREAKEEEERKALEAKEAEEKRIRDEEEAEERRVAAERAEQERLEREAREERERMLAAEQAEAKEESLCGFRVHFLEDLIALHGRAKLVGMSTAQFTSQIVRPRTAATKHAYTRECFDDPTQRHKVGIASLVVCHAAECGVLDLFDAVLDFAARHQDQLGEDPVVWLDALSVSQHKDAARNRAVWVQATIDAAGPTRSVLVVLSPHEKPAALTRAWCVLEMWACVAKSGQLYMTLPPREKRKLLEETKAYPPFFKDMVAGLHAAESESGREEDQQLILAELARRGFGLEEVDGMVIVALADACCEMLQVELARERNAVERGRTMCALGSLLTDMGRSSEGLGWLEEGVGVLREEEGVDGAHTVEGLEMRNTAYAYEGRGEDVVKGWSEVVEARKRGEGEESASMLHARSRLAEARSYMGEHREAVAEHELVLAARRRKHGEEDEETLAAMLSVGQAQYHARQRSTAVGTLRECVELHVKVLGAEHCETLRASYWLAMALQALGKAGEAIAVMRQCVTAREQTCGADHVLTAEARDELVRMQAAPEEGEDVDDAARSLETSSRLLSRLNMGVLA